METSTQIRAHSSGIGIAVTLSTEKLHTINPRDEAYPQSIAMMVKGYSVSFCGESAMAERPDKRGLLGRHNVAVIYYSIEGYEAQRLLKPLILV